MGKVKRYFNNFRLLFVLTPVLLLSFSQSFAQNARVIAIAAGNWYTVALKDDGTVVAWGWNRDGQCNVPAGLKDVIAIAAGSQHTVALKDDGTVVAWGYNRDGQCNVPAGLKNVIAIAAGEKHTAALLRNRQVVVWGEQYWMPDTFE